MWFKSISIAVLMGASAATPAHALEQPTQPAQAAAGTSPHDNLVCERIIATGTRLGPKQVCMTREQWANRQLQERQGVERAQAAPCMPTTTDSQGHTAC